MGRTGKEIYRRFRISNQIFASIYRSRDIARSLDTTFPVFGKNHNYFNFVDGYLENRIFAGHAVLQEIHRHFVLSFSIKKRCKFMARFPAKIQKCSKIHVLVCS